MVRCVKSAMENIEEDDFLPKAGEASSAKKLKRVVSYQVFVLENKSKLHGKYPFLKPHQINGKLKSMWNRLSTEEKGNYRKFSLVSPPKPSKKSPKNKKEPKKNTCEGRLLTPRAQQENMVIDNVCDQDAEFPTLETSAEEAGELSPFKAEVKQNSTPTDQWDKSLLGPYYDSEDEIDTCTDDKSEMEDKDYLGSSRKDTPVPWPKKCNTYSSKYPVQKNYKVPEVVTDSNMPDTPGILKSANKENRPRKGRVSFSTKDVEVKVMSEREDSCSDLTETPELNASTLAKQCYDFDAIDEFEICFGTPEKTRMKKSPAVNRNSISPTAEPEPAKTKKTTKQKKNSPKMQNKRMLRSRPSNNSSLTSTSTLHEKFVFKFDEPSSSPSCQEADSGGGDAETSIHEEEDLISGKAGPKWLPEHLLAGGDNQTVVNADDSLKTKTPPSLDTSKNTSSAIMAPKKRRQTNQSKKQGTRFTSHRTELEREPTCIKQPKRRSPRITGKDTCKATPSTPNKIDSETKELKKSTSKKLIEVCINAIGDKSEKDNTIQDDSLIGSSKMLNWPQSDTFLKPEQSYFDEMSSSSEQELLSPVMLESKARSSLSVAETLRGLKMITSPDNIPFSDDSISDSPKILSPTLSDISVLSSLSSGSEGVIDPTPVQSRPVVKLKADVNRKLHPRGSHLRITDQVINTQNRSEESKASQLSSLSSGSEGVIDPTPVQSRPVVKADVNRKLHPRGDHHLRTTAQVINTQNCSEESKTSQRQGEQRKKESLCDMFEDMTPPEKKMTSTRRLVSSCKKKTSKNFARLFHEDEIFG